ncbi:MAG TPA: ATP-dependent sacrificial sulfur transferase LarE [Gemmatimonadales bacterium]
MPLPTPLERLLAEYPSLLVGYSGGVDSALVAVVARRVLGSQRTVAAIGRSASFPSYQRQQALDIARQFDVRLFEIDTHELDDADYVANAPSRCYFCKRELWTRLCALAERHGMAAVADGTNADDIGDHRPGLAAAAERRVRAPLAEAGYTKAMVRAEARALRIPIWDAPASPCLSSRILYGLSVTPARLAQVERCEALLRALGVSGDLRVRHRGGEARIEVSARQFGRLRAQRDVIARGFLDLGFERVTLDLDGYRRGSLLAAAEPRIELLAERA